MRTPDPADRDRFRLVGACLGHQLLKSDKARAERLLEIVHHGGGVKCRRCQAVDANVNDTADDLENLDVDAVRMEMAADHVQRFFGHQPAIDRNEVVRHEQHADGGIAYQAIDERVAAHAADNVHEMRKA